MIGTKREKSCKFQEGIAPYLQHSLAPLMIKDYAEVYEEALVIEQKSQRRASDSRGQQRKRTSGPGWI